MNTEKESPRVFCTGCDHLKDSTCGQKKSSYYKMNIYRRPVRNCKFKKLKSADDIVDEIANDLAKAKNDFGESNKSIDKPNGVIAIIDTSKAIRRVSDAPDADKIAGVHDQDSVAPKFLDQDYGTRTIADYPTDDSGTPRESPLGDGNQRKGAEFVEIKYNEAKPFVNVNENGISLTPSGEKICSINPDCKIDCLSSVGIILQCPHKKKPCPIKPDCEIECINERGETIYICPYGSDKTVTIEDPVCGTAIKEKDLVMVDLTAVRPIDPPGTIGRAMEVVCSYCHLPDHSKETHFDEVLKLYNATKKEIERCVNEINAHTDRIKIMNLAKDTLDKNHKKEIESLNLTNGVSWLENKNLKIKLEESVRCFVLLTGEFEKAKEEAKEYKEKADALGEAIDEQSNAAAIQRRHNQLRAENNKLKDENKHLKIQLEQYKPRVLETKSDMVEEVKELEKVLENINSGENVTKSTLSRLDSFECDRIPHVLVNMTIIQLERHAKANNIKLDRNHRKLLLRTCAKFSKCTMCSDLHNE